jgi:hypothetical protein
LGELNLWTAVISQEQGRFPGAVWCGSAIEWLIHYLINWIEMYHCRGEYSSCKREK